ncbi:putative membrane protein SpoIIM required for sporulation [Cryobacterium mesophilum]|uniref:Stage II sporulation protein M n=1 Tax=Terrimesophilobacter mesophilus TaxID=433647 RepID=A0A4R8VA81_9MICO|nr:stage II sporulation protein M [Terrimesophilobacter mesophilus]MBB5632633.1 putative membrane protein SpoIIM required for sporulation [Terrimesophilobacter mesophilus]TFB79445.1 stage II sporulation protein M [Terrimesophilobacter mesophilus]
MDLDAYSAAHREEWDELARLASRRRLSGADADRLIDRYQSGASQLSAMKATAGSSVQGDRLSLGLSRARVQFTGAGRNVLSRLPAFFANQLPAALYRIRWLSLAVAVVTAIVAVLYAWWALSTPGVLQNFGTEELRRKFAEEDFVNYYSENGMGSFTALVWTNNAWLAAQCVAFGIVGVYAPYLLFSNAQNLGLSAALMGAHDRLDVFFLYIAPHGQLELYSIFVAGAAGIMIFWSWIAPGHRTRVQALAEDGRALITVAIGLAIALFVSGIIEGFVTRQDWPWVIKIGIGTIALAAFLCYQWIVGRHAVRAGETGDLDEFESGARTIVAG